MNWRSPNNGQKAPDLPRHRLAARNHLVATAKSVNRLSIGIVALGATLVDSGLFPLGAFKDSISTLQKKSNADISLQALEAGAAVTRKRGS